MPGSKRGPGGMLPPGAMTLPGDDTRVPTYKARKKGGTFSTTVPLLPIKRGLTVHTIPLPSPPPPSPAPLPCSPYAYPYARDQRSSPPSIMCAFFPLPTSEQKKNAEHLSFPVSSSTYLAKRPFSPSFSRLLHSSLSTSSFP